MLQVLQVAKVIVIQNKNTVATLGIIFNSLRNNKHHPSLLSPKKARAFEDYVGIIDFSIFVN